MDKKSFFELIDFCVEYIKTGDSNGQNWLIGTTDKPEIQLFKKHNVSRSLGWRFYKKMPDNIVAQEVARYLADGLKTQRNILGDERAVYIYGYHIEKTTT